MKRQQFWIQSFILAKSQNFSAKVSNIGIINQNTKDILYNSSILIFLLDSFNHPCLEFSLWF